MSPFVAALLGGLIGGVACGVVILSAVALFGRSFAERFFRQQVEYLEHRFKEKVLDALLAKVSLFLDQSERIGQIARRVVEVVQLIVRGGPLPDERLAGAPAGARSLAQSHALVGSTLAALGRKEDARRSFEEALRLDPAQAMALEGLRELAKP
jgi:hypothetical protein